MNDTTQPDANQPVPTEPEALAAPVKVKNKGGRPKGSKNKITVKRLAEIETLSAHLNETIPNAFHGDSHALLCCIYKNPEYPIDLRLDAAKAAIKFEKPALASTEMTGKDGSALNPAAPPQFIVQFIDPEPSGDGS